MMRRLTFGLIATVVLAGAMTTVSCDKEKRQGCTDPLALNYDPVAEESNGMCEYLDSTVTVWAGGQAGFWGADQTTGQIEMLSCFGTGDSITLDIDTAGNGTDAFFLTKQSDGKFGVVAQIINRQDARPFGNGFLRFQTQLPTNSDVEEFQVYIHGGTCGNFGSCADICRTGGINISTDNMTDSTWTVITLPLLDFQNRKLFSLDNVFTLDGGVATGGDTVLYVRNIEWKTVLD